MHETSALDKVSKFIYALPDFMVSTKFDATFEYPNIYIEIEKYNQIEFHNEINFQ